ncbi:MAG: shikimate dehydrogenase [Acidimicrobiales bacterium]|nr:shikimate dehydrogenase [Acidimicrobiales bacterium]
MADLIVDRRPPVTGATRLAAVIGDPVRHSLSPTLLGAAFAETGLDWTYVALEVAEGTAARALDGMAALGISGLSVTMPHKSAIAAAVDRCTEDAGTLNAVNCVVVEDGELVGYNTDGGGFLDGLKRDAGLDVDGMSVVVLGAGGAARAVVRALASAGATDVVVANRTIEGAEVAASLAGGVGRPIGLSADGCNLALTDALDGAALVVNATSVGMGGIAVDARPVDPTLVNADAVAVDLIYHPVETAWMAALRKRGVEVHGGLSMLVCQAARAFTLWTGSQAPVAAMDAAARTALTGR